MAKKSTTDSHAFSIKLAGWDITFRGAEASTAADSFLQQFRERAAQFGESAALDSVANWCATLPAAMPVETDNPAALGAIPASFWQPRLTSSREARG